MGRVFSSLKRELINYNVEEKAHKILSKPIKSAPSHPSTQKLKEATKDRGITMDELSKKHEELDEYLKKVYLVSSSETVQPSQSERPLPMERFNESSNLEYGYKELESTTRGKISLKQTLAILTKYHEDSKEWTPAKLASEYKITPKFAEQIIDRYQVFELHDVKDPNEDKKSMQSRFQLKKAVHNIREITLLADKKKQEETSKRQDSLENVKTTPVM